MAFARVEIIGLRELRAQLRKVDVALGRGLGREIKAAAEVVVAEAKRRAAEMGLAPPGRSGRSTGALVRSIKPSVRGTTGRVRETAQRAGFAYPVIYEYGGSGRVGGRPFLRPAIDAKREEIVALFRRGIERLVREAGLS